MRPYKIYWCLVLVRFLTVLVPQWGYIHPDEFFQSLEVLIGKFFEAEATVPWEFNMTQPLRSMTVPYFTIGMSVKLVRDLNYFTREYFSTTLLKPYYLLTAPRLLMCSLSLLIDYSLYKICRINNEVCSSRLLILATSYVVVVYGTRTLSNTIELILLSLLLYYVSESLIFSNIIIRRREYLNYRYENSETPVDRAKFHKLRVYLKSDMLRNCVPICLITAVGFFNRPTFLAFGAAPVFLWLYRGLGSKSVTNTVFNLRVTAFLVCSFPIVLIIVTIDSFYYGYVTWGEIGMLDVGLSSFVFTPYNFIKYNLNSRNLETHGIHPRWLHWFVNVPLLYNVLAVWFFTELSQYSSYIYQRKFHLLPTLRSIKGLMLLTIISSITLLSMFPHQEPRFLIPLIVPLTYLYGSRILKEPTTIIMETEQSIKQTKPAKSSSHYIKLYLLVNFLCLLFFGFLHQGGVSRSVDYLSEQINSNPNEFHIVTSHVYTLPQAMFLQPSQEKIFRARNTKYKVLRRVYLYEEGSKSLKVTLKKVELLLRVLSEKKPSRGWRVYLIVPGSLYYDLLVDVPGGLRTEVEEVFRGHVSTESLPFGNGPGRCRVGLTVADLWLCARDLFDSVSLYLIKFTLD